MKILAIGDIHHRTDNPVGRKDNYKQAIEAKIRECFDIARKYRVNYVVITGDIFDSPNIAWSTAADLFELLKEAPAPILTVAGNHDLPAGNIDALRRVPLGFGFRLKYLTNVADQPYQDSPDAPIISGSPYSYAMDEDKSLYGVPYEESNNQTRIHVTHGNLYDHDPGIPNMKWTSFEEVASLPNAPDILINGHIHNAMPVKKIGRTLFVCPGALCRVKADIKEIARTVQVALIDVPPVSERSGGSQPTVTMIPLESAAPGEEVLSREHLVKAAEVASRRDDFLQLISGTERQALDVYSILDGIDSLEISNKDGESESIEISESVRLGARKRLADAIELLNPSAMELMGERGVA